VTPALVRSALEAWPHETGIGWPSWAFSNHDAPRAVSRWAAFADRNACAQLGMLLLVSLRGNIFVYQGEELGLPQAEVAFEDLKDPEAIANWPLTLGRDGARTPMPWSSLSIHAGFTTAHPWLPVAEAHQPLAVDVQEADRNSQLHVARRLIAMRKRHSALRAGTMQITEASADVLVFYREWAGERIVCAFNFGSATRALHSAPSGAWRVLESVGGAVEWTLPPGSGLLAKQVL
jgi:alpha-glucosidase